MQPLHLNITRTAVAASLASAATTLYAVASPMHSLLGYATDKIEAASVIIGAAAALVAGAGRSLLTPSVPPTTPPSNVPESLPLIEVAVLSNPMPPVQAGKAA
jgi:hypothetical protein